ncbi:MAG: thiamine-phosphate kinase [Proteobacteria bacterium]|nr:MAG: thiamine-phosphate kinase [Pseudomonadota bacterium]
MIWRRCSMNEIELIESLKRLCPSNDSVILGIDDDAAILKATLRESLVCADMLMDGSHFLLNEAGPERIGHKALAVNLSDIAAMGGRALSAFVSLALPKHLAHEAFLLPFYRGMSALAREFDVAIAGGDTNIWNGPLVVNVTVLGEAHAKGPVRRSTAKAGDRIFVTGPLGNSIEGHHLSFRPRLDEAKQLMDEFTLNSMMDISDGLGKDLRTICRQSAVGARIDRAAIPIRDTLKNHPDALQKAFCDGEDFELCFTLSEVEAQRLLGDQSFAYCRAIGRISEGQDILWSDDLSPILWQGFEHQS